MIGIIRSSVTPLFDREGWEEHHIECAGERIGTVARHVPTGKLYALCGRCWGSGNYSFNLSDGTRCYGCNGRGYTGETTEADELRKARRRASARKSAERKRQAEQRERDAAATEWRDAHPDVVDLFTRYAGENDFIGDLAAKMAWQPLTDRQVEAGQDAVQRVIARQAEDAKRQALGHYGTVGEKVTIEVELVKARYFASQRFDRSSQYLVTMRTAEGHTLKAWSSGAFGDDAYDLIDKHGKGHRVTITGTVKEHGEYNDNPETTLTRVKIK